MPTTQAFSGEGEMARLTKGHDWSRTPLGPVAQWPEGLKSAVRLILGSRFPMFVWWGPQFIQVYNDAYAPMLGQRHPGALGLPGSAVWSDIWHMVGPQAESVLAEGRSTWNDRLLLVMQRKGYTEETYFTFSYSPAYDDAGQVGGVFCVVMEETERVLGERRLQSLRALSIATHDARSAESVCRRAVQALAANAHDLPFVLVWLADGPGGLRLAACSAAAEGTAIAPARCTVDEDAPWPFHAAAATRTLHTVHDLAARWGAIRAGPWPEPVQEAVVLPMAGANAATQAGFVVVGVSPRRRMDEAYRDYLTLAVQQVASALGDARAFEAEQQRAESLAELDRAKTTFFTNISHEFRTPLTLMLGPLEELAERLPRGASRHLAQTARRNAERLLKLVNTLLDFARIEGGRADARYTATDLASCTADLASSFRSACERAGLRLDVDCPPLPERVYVDRDLWEKVVLNLLSNAFKFTFEGGISVRLRASGDGRQAELSVADTGSGIAADDLPKLFQRFQRIEGTRSRSVEGSGIGLSLVAEVVKLHHGSIEAASEPGRGTTFTVRLPFGRDHLPAERVGDAAPRRAGWSQTSAFVGEALQWLPQAAGPDAGDTLSGALDGAGPQRSPAGAEAPRVLVADDNADLRTYLARLLGGQYRVQAVDDGEQAWQALDEGSFDLLVADVMMPRLDGFGVVARLRADPRLRTLPVILLSARAGEEARLEGLAAGADDYLVKPFSARELMARVSAHLAAARIRREAQRELERSEEQLREADRRKDEFLATLAHELRNPLAPIRNAVHLLARADRQGQFAAVREMLERQVNHMVRLVDDLLEVSRISRGKIVLRPERLQLDAVLDAALESSRPGIDQAGHRLHVARWPEPLFVQGDAVRLTQVFVNLLNNAARYTDPGGDIRIRVLRDGGTAVVTVADNGIGIAPEQLSQLFEMFSQVDRSHERAHGGLGIGLGLAQRLVQMHGGTIEAASDGLGRGSRFTVRLPLVEGAAQGPAHAGRESPPVPARRVLVVDDNRDAADSTAQLVSMLGSEARVAYEGAAALELAEHWRPDVVLLDIGMPGMDGYELARRLRDRLGDVAPVMIAVTGWGQAEDRARARAAGFGRHVVKPVDLPGLRRLLAGLS